MSEIAANKIKRLFNYYNVQSEYPIKEPVVLIMFLSWMESSNSKKYIEQKEMATGRGYHYSTHLN